MTGAGPYLAPGGYIPETNHVISARGGEEPAIRTESYAVHLRVRGIRDRVVTIALQAHVAARSRVPEDYRVAIVARCHCVSIRAEGQGKRRALFRVEGMHGLPV